MRVEQRITVLLFCLVLFCLMSTVYCQRKWEIQRNGFTEKCCFCDLKALRTGEHVIQECVGKIPEKDYREIGKKLGYRGPPKCSCGAFKKYPRCPSNPIVCGTTVNCQNNNIVYENCKTARLLSKRTMTCNDSLQWEHDLDCENTCLPSFNISNGSVKCEQYGNRTICNIECNDGYVAEETENLLCANAKKNICHLQPIIPPSKNGLKIQIGIIVGCILLGIAAIGVILKLRYRKYRGMSPLNSNTEFPMTAMQTQVPPMETSTSVVSAETPLIENPMPVIPTEASPIGNSMSESGRVNNLQDEAVDPIPDDEAMNPTHDGPISLIYDEGLLSMGLPRHAESLESIAIPLGIAESVPHDGSETPPKTLWYEDEYNTCVVAENQFLLSRATDKLSIMESQGPAL